MTTEYIVKHLHCSAVFANKMIADSKGNEELLYKWFLDELIKRNTYKDVVIVQ